MWDLKSINTSDKNRQTDAIQIIPFWNHVKANSKKNKTRLGNICILQHQVDKIHNKKQRMKQIR